MKRRNVLYVLFVILSTIVLAALVIGIMYHFITRRTYKLNLPQPENLKSISLKQNEDEKVITDDEEIKDLLELIGGVNGVKRVTKEESIQDSPVNTDNEIRIDFNFAESGTSTIFIYEKNNNYYIEQPYNGIYQINKDEYDSIEKTLNNSPI